jgi:uncharacterized membrane protein
MGRYEEQEFAGSPLNNDPTGYPPETDETPRDRVDYESKPLTRTEYLTALAHFYRGEMYRAQVWRTRLDTTTNWAVLATVGILTFSFNNPEYSQETLIAGMLANLVFLLLEARRFRFFDVWRSRVRMIEENFYGPILRRDLTSPTEHWGAQVADDLLQPKFKISMAQAMKARLLRNYVYVFVFLLIAWLGRAAVLPRDIPRDFNSLFGVGDLPGWVLVAIVATLYLALLGLIVLTPRAEPPELCYWPDPRHSGMDVPSLDV